MKPDATLMQMITNHARRVDLEPGLVAAVAFVESSYQSWSVRYEPQYRWLYDVDRLAKTLSIPKITEETSQRFSYGLMQVMGAVAREYGFAGRYLSELCDPNQSLRYGCLHLSRQMKRYEGNWCSAVAAYNAGHAKMVGSTYANQTYVDKVRRAYLGA